jgi:hypothetical protein
MSGETEQISKKDKTDENRENRSVSVSVSRRALIMVLVAAAARCSQIVQPLEPAVVHTFLLLLLLLLLLPVSTRQ